MGEPAATDGELRVAALTPLTTIDFPDHLAAVVFCQGCPWRCRYCHNPAFIGADRAPALSWQAVDSFLQSRRGLLDAIVFSGGEPCAQAQLPAAIARAKRLGFKVGLHSGGAYPRRLREVLPQLDWVGLDIKQLPEHYRRVTGVPHSGDALWQCVRELADSGVPFECRTTVHPQLIDADELVSLAQQLAQLGVKRYAVQTCGPGAMLDTALAAEKPPPRWRAACEPVLASLFTQFSWR